MQSRAARLGLIAAVVVAAIVVFVVLRSNNSDTSKNTAKGVQVKATMFRLTFHSSLFTVHSSWNVHQATVIA